MRQIAFSIPRLSDKNRLLKELHELIDLIETAKRYGIPQWRIEQIVDQVVDRPTKHYAFVKQCYDAIALEIEERVH